MADDIRHVPPRKDADLIPVRMCNEFVYCPRLFHLEFVQGIFIDSADTVAGAAEHARAERKGSRRAKKKKEKEAAEAEANADAEREAEAADLYDRLPPRSMVLQSEAWGVTGKFDVVEYDHDEVVVVEAKHGKAPTDRTFQWHDHALPSDAWPADVTQVGLYMALLRDFGLPCHRGRIYYRGSRTRVEIAWSDDLERFLRDVVAEARKVAAIDTPPAPLVDSPKCIGCSLHPACLPDEHAALEALERGQDPGEVRRIVPSRDDRAIVHVVSPGALVRKDGEALVVETRMGDRTRIPLIDVQHVALFGRTHITEPCLQHLLRVGIPISHHTGAGRLLGITAPTATVNIGLRRAQFRGADDPARCLEVARGVVVAKLKNQRTILRRYRKRAYDFPENTEPDLPEWAESAADEADDSVAPQAEHEPEPADGSSRAADRDANAGDAPSPAARLAEAIRRMGIAIDAASRATDIDALRGHEGDGAAVYFGALPLVLPEAFRGDFGGRTRRPPRDRVNALLSFGYAMLVREATAACVRVGLDPMLGFFHTMIPGRPALALDLMEPFRAAWVDTAILRLLATGGIARSDFHVSMCGVTLTDAGKRALIGAYERRAEELTTHPRFGYRMSYRRMLELEARVLGKFLLGEVKSFQPLWTR